MAMLGMVSQNAYSGAPPRRGASLTPATFAAVVCTVILTVSPLPEYDGLSKVHVVFEGSPVHAVLGSKVTVPANPLSEIETVAVPPATTVYCVVGMDMVKSCTYTVGWYGWASVETFTSEVLIESG